MNLWKHQNLALKFKNIWLYFWINFRFTLISEKLSRFFSASLLKWNMIFSLVDNEIITSINSLIISCLSLYITLYVFMKCSWAYIRHENNKGINKRKKNYCNSVQFCQKDLRRTYMSIKGKENSLQIKLAPNIWSGKAQTLNCNRLLFN